MLAAWVAFTAFCFGLSRWQFSPTAWLGQIETDSASAIVVLPARAAKPAPATTPTGPAVVSRPRRVATTLSPVLKPPSQLPVHGGGFRPTSETVAFIGDQERATAPGIAVVSDLLPPSEPQTRSGGVPRPSEPRDEASPFQEDFHPERQDFDSSPVRLSSGPLFETSGRTLLAPSQARPPEEAAATPARLDVDEPSAKGGVAHTGGGCERAFATAERRIDIASRTTKDVSQESYAQKLEQFSSYAHCGVPDDMNLSVCAAVQLGRVRGVTVTTYPARPAVARCVARVVQGFSFPSSTNPDLVRTEFTSQ